ncbi:MAG: HAMP domain-containing sensor histidine kinase [Verrucomicrobiota bacterium]
MISSKYLPFAILTLILCSAITVLALGFRFAKEEQVVKIEQDRGPLSNFTTKLLGEVESLERLYQNQLINIRDRIGRHTSSIEISSICRKVIGVEQVTIFRENARPLHLDLRDADRSEALSLPHESGDDSIADGIIIDVEMFNQNLLGTNFKWLNHPGSPPHFVAKLDYKSLLVLRINPERVSAAADAWLAEWISDNFDQVKIAGIPTLLKNPLGQTIASTGDIQDDRPPDMLLPLPSAMGEWKISSWELKKTITSYRQPVLIGSATLAIVLVLAGFFGYAQQQSATRLAEQRVSFVNRVSHELRTPMTNILLNVDLLSDSLTENDSPRSKRLGLIREEASRLSRLLENVLTFSEREKIRSNPRQKLQPISCDIGLLISEVTSQFTPTLTRKHITVALAEPDAGIFAIADPDAFKQIISNLVSNVEKYASKGGKLEFEITTSPAKQTVTVSVIDHGPGIAKSEAGRVFRPFIRLNDSTTEGVSGTGLGLAIARDLAGNMNGKLKLIPQQRGARFELTLPLATDNIISIAS